MYKYCVFQKLQCSPKGVVVFYFRLFDAAVVERACGAEETEQVEKQCYHLLTENRDKNNIFLL